MTILWKFQDYKGGYSLHLLQHSSYMPGYYPVWPEYPSPQAGGAFPGMLGSPA